MASRAIRRRVFKELPLICDGKWNEKLVAIKVPDPSDVTHLQGIIISPHNAPSAEYIFFVDIHLPSNYPFKAPTMSVVNMIWHPKLQPRRGGRICLSELSEAWKPSLTFETLLVTIQTMLGDPGKMFTVITLNEEAKEQFYEDHKAYQDQAVSWAEKDNEGFGMVQFHDLRLAAIQSVLAIPNVIGHECHLFCKRESRLSVQIVAVVIPSLTIYREKIERDYMSVMKRLTYQPVQFNTEVITISTSKMSRDKCWQVSISDATFSKTQVDHFDPRKELPPRCQITLTWLRPEREPHAFKEKIEIKGGLRTFDVHVDPAGLSSSQRPTLPLLLNLPLSSDRRINIAEAVGANYFDFGLQLLDDETGQVIKSIVSEMQRVPRDINREILMQWLQGRGKPVTWAVLIGVFKTTDLAAIATDVESACAHF